MTAPLISRKNGESKEKQSVKEVALAVTLKMPALVTAEVGLGYHWVFT